MTAEPEAFEYVDDAPTCDPVTGVCLVPGAVDAT
jgi:hypothetical protein